MKSQFADHKLSPVAVIGAGGHALMVISDMQAAGYTIGGLFDDDVTQQGRERLGIRVLGPPEQIAAYGFRRAIIAIGDNQARRAMVARFPDLDWVTFIHPLANVHPSVRLGRGTAIMIRAIVRAEASVGDHVIINAGAVVGHECTVGDFAHVAGSAHLGGNSHVGEGVMLGIGAIIIPGKSVGAWATIGAGGVVVKDIPPHVTAVGVPAKVKRSNRGIHE